MCRELVYHGRLDFGTAEAEVAMAQIIDEHEHDLEGCALRLSGGSLTLSQAMSILFNYSFVFQLHRSYTAQMASLFCLDSAWP